MEFDIKTGNYVRTLVDLGVAGKEGINGIVYAPDTQHYYLASGSDVYEVDAGGHLIAGYNSPALKKAYGIALLPEQFRSVFAQRSAVERTTNPFSAAITTLKMTIAGRLQNNGHSGERYQVMATTDFKDWQLITTLENSTGNVEFVDPDAGKYEKRFYRLEMLPQER